MWDRARMGLRRRPQPPKASKRGVLVPLALLAAALLAGCGSSSGGTTGSTTAAQHTTSVPASGETSTSGSSLRVAGRPKFATPSKSEPVQSGTVQISYRNITARPVTLRVKAGTVVRFVNYDPFQHNATSVGGPQHFASKNFGQGGSFEVKLTKPGIVHFECTLHPVTINGSIEVV
jgi:plastocyanin